MKSYQARCLEKLAVFEPDKERAKTMREEAVSEMFTILNTNNITDDEFHAIHKEMIEWLNHDQQLPEIRAKYEQIRKKNSREVDAYLASKND